MCATSIGSTFSHSPVPGERKSGIPDGTEIPAPVSATTEPAARTSARPSGRRRRLLSGPATAAALAQEGAMPSVASSLAKTAAKPAFSASMPSSRSPLPRDLLDLRRRASGAWPASLRAQASAVSSSSWSATTRLTRPNSKASSALIASPMRFISSALFAPTRRGRRWVPPKPGMIPSLISGWPKMRRPRGDAHVAGHRQLAAAAEGEAVDRGDRRDARRAPASRSSAWALVEQLARRSASSIFVNALMSAPAQNSSGLDEAMTSARDARALDAAPRPCRGRSMTCRRRSSSSGRWPATRSRRRRASRA